MTSCRSWRPWSAAGRGPSRAARRGGGGPRGGPAEVGGVGGRGGDGDEAPPAGGAVRGRFAGALPPPGGGHSKPPGGGRPGDRIGREPNATPDRADLHHRTGRDHPAMKTTSAVLYGMKKPAPYAQSRPTVG